MATAFRRKGSRLVGRLDENERAIVVGLLLSTRELLDPDADGSSEDDDPFAALVADFDRPAASDADVAERDPALQRLLPPASRDDADLARDFRALTEDSLRRRKVSTMNTAIAALTDRDVDRVELDLGQAQALMIALADVRLVLGERLDLRTDEDSERIHALAEDPGNVNDPMIMGALVYDLLTWLQESVAQALLN